MNKLSSTIKILGQIHLRIERFDLIFWLRKLLWMLSSDETHILLSKCCYEVKIGRGDADWSDFLSSF